jgi:ABC-2 type transport system ATP-binding protein
MVACGSVDELTARAESRLVVTASQAREGWAANLAGVRIVSERDGTSVLELDSGADDQAVLAAALRTGPVTEFSRRRRSLAELFRDAVSAAPATDAAAEGAPA